MDVAAALEARGVRASAHRVAVAEYVLRTHDHPSADEVWERVRGAFPHISRATVYNTLAAFVEAGLLVKLCLSEGHAVYDPNVERHHHFVDEASGRITDLPWDAVDVKIRRVPAGVEVDDVSVVLRGRATSRARRSPSR